MRLGAAAFPPLNMTVNKGDTMSNLAFAPQNDDEPSPLAAPPATSWSPYHEKSARLKVFASDPDMVRLAQIGVDPDALTKTLEKIGAADPKNGVRDNARQLQSSRGTVQNWCEQTANAPSIKDLSDQWDSTYPNIGLKKAAAAEEQVRSVAASYTALNTNIEDVIAKTTLIANQWSGSGGWRNTAMSLANNIQSNPNDKKSIALLEQLFTQYLIPDLNDATTSSTAAQTKASSFVGDLGGAVSQVNNIDQALENLVSSLQILEQGDMASYQALKSTETALEKAVPGLAIGGAVAGIAGCALLDMPPPLDAIGGVMVIGGVITELAALGTAIAIAVIAGKMASLQSKITSESQSITEGQVAQQIFQQLVNGGPQVMQYANSFDTALNNIVSDYGSVVSEVKKTNPSGPFIVQQISAIDNAWSEVYQDGQTLKTLGFATEKTVRIKASDWAVKPTDTPQGYLNRLNALAS